MIMYVLVNILKIVLSLYYAPKVGYLAKPFLGSFALKVINRKNARFMKLIGLSKKNLQPLRKMISPLNHPILYVIVNQIIYN